MNLIINPQFESLCPPLSEGRDGAWAVTDCHADRARLQAELDQARAELELARWPWWSRLWDVR